MIKGQLVRPDLLEGHRRSRAAARTGMNVPSALLNDLSEHAIWRLEEICCRFEQAWQAGQRPLPEEFLAGAEGALRLALLRELLGLDVDYRRQAGERPSRQDYATR